MTPKKFDKLNMFRNSKIIAFSIIVLFLGWVCVRYNPYLWAYVLTSNNSSVQNYSPIALTWGKTSNKRVFREEIVKRVDVCIQPNGKLPSLRSIDCLIIYLTNDSSEAISELVNRMWESENWDSKLISLKVMDCRGTSIADNDDFYSYLSSILNVDTNLTHQEYALRIIASARSDRFRSVIAEYIRFKKVSSWFAMYNKAIASHILADFGISEDTTIILNEMSNLTSYFESSDSLLFMHAVSKIDENYKRYLPKHFLRYRQKFHNTVIPSPVPYFDECCFFDCYELN